MARTTGNLVLFAAAAFALVATACNTGGGGAEGDLTGTIQIDGSSTVAPISQAVAEAFNGEAPGVNAAVGTSGTGGGFAKFCNGDIDIADASRPIEDTATEKKACDKNGIEYVELKVAIDGLSVVVNERNDFAECFTVEELKKIWEPNSSVSTWKDVKAEWPDDKIQLYGPGADSGTFDYFTKEIVGTEKSSRKDYTQSENDNQLVKGVGGEQFALGYFGYAYFAENEDKLNAAAVDGGDGCTEPTQETIESGDYAPLARPLFIYANVEALEKEHVSAFVTFYLENVSDLVQDVGYVAAPGEDIDAAKQALDEATAG